MFTLIIAAAGSSARAGVNKIFAELNGRTVLERAVIPFLQFKEITEIIVTLPKGQIADGEKILKPLFKNVLITEGGNSRYLSVKNALSLVKTPYVIVHDGARPFVTKKIIEDNLSIALKFGSAVTAIPSVDTVAFGEETEEKIIGKTGVKNIQTPETFLTEELKQAYALSSEEFTDESGLYLKYIKPPHFSSGDIKNKKITYKEDLTPDYLTGCGFDCHKLAEGRKFILGGIEIDHPKGLLGHSDADVLCHALSDAILSALGLPDIGRRFPDDDPKFLNANSILLLNDAFCEVKKRNYSITNVSAVVMAEKPKLNPYADRIKEKLSAVLDTPKEYIGLTFTTLEGLGFIGREEGVAASATVILN